MDSGQLALLLEGIDMSKVKRPKKWVPPQKNSKNVGIRDRQISEGMILHMGANS
jgi:hypothetical protein